MEIINVRNMKGRDMKWYKLIILPVLMPALLYAQNAVDRILIPEQAQTVPNAGHYIVALIAGVILAVAFQLILTNLSVAAGLNVLSTVTSEDKKGTNKGQHVSDSGTPTIGESARTISSAFGIWTLLTASIALFFASWLAGELSLTSSPTIGAVLGLVIWGLFYVAMMTIEVSAISSLVGSLVRLAATGLRTAYSMTSSIFSKSDETKMADTAAKITGAVKEELFGDVDADDVKKQIQTYINQLKPQHIDPHQIAVEFAKVLDHTELQAVEQHSGPFLSSEVLTAHLRTNGYTDGAARTMANTVTTAFQTIKQEASGGKDKVSAVTDTALQMAGMSHENAEKTRVEIENYLRSTGKEELNPDAIKRDMERLFTDPKGAGMSLKERLSHIDRDTIAKVISERRDISREEAQNYVNRVFDTFNSITSGTLSMKENIMSKLQNYLKSVNRPEMDYEGISHDVQKIFHDPKAGTEALMRRIKSIDRETIKSMLASRSDISEEHAERIVSRIEEARDSFLQKIDQMKMEVERRMEMAKQEAVHQADEVRKTASTAAWWAFGTAVISGITAALGGIVAAQTF